MARLLAVTLFLSLFLFTALTQPKTIRVPQDQATIQGAINAAVNGDTVLVDEGTYFVNLRLTKKLTLASRYLVDADTSHISRTILDGSTPPHPDTATVITVGLGTDTTTVIIGFTIRNGAGTKAIINGTFAIGGGGIGVVGGGATIRRNRIVGNSLTGSVDAPFAAGAGICIRPVVGPLERWIIEDNDFAGNEVRGRNAGGSACNLTGTGRVVRNKFVNNAAIAVDIPGPDNVTCYGGGLYLWAGTTSAAEVLIDRNLFTGNHAYYGSALFIIGENSTGYVPIAMISNNIIVNNFGHTPTPGIPQDSGAVHFQRTNSRLINNTIAGNTGNYAIRIGVTPHSVLMMNNVVWDPAAGATQIRFATTAPTSVLTANYNCIFGGYVGAGNVSANPLFVPGDPLYRLQDSSPCLNAGVRSATLAGVPLSAPSTDFEGLARPRPAYTNPDMGALESSIGRGTIRVPQDQATIQAAINAAVNGDTVLVDEGTYLVNLILTKKIILGSRYIVDGDTSHISKTILDGSTPTHADSASVILIQGEADSTTQIVGFTLTKGGGTKIIAPINLGGPYYTYRSGGAVQVLAAGARISHNIIRNNTCVGPSTLGNIANDPAVSIWGDLTWTAGPRYWIIEHNLIKDNQTTGYGAEGCAIRGGGVGRIVGNVIINNRSTGSNYSNGAVAVWGAPGPQDVLISGNFIKGNIGGTGAAISAWGIDWGTLTYRPVVTFTNNMIVGNGSGGVSTIYTNTGDYRFINNTIASNLAPRTIQLSEGRGSTSNRFFNNIIWNPSASTGEFYIGGLAVGSYNLVRTGFAGDGNITSDPWLVGTDTLMPSITPNHLSPVMGKGLMSATINGLLMTAPSTDFLGHPRPRTATSNPDLGAIETDLITLTEDVVSTIPSEFALDQNYPNPFNPETKIGFRMKERGRVEVSVMNILGQRVAVLVEGERAAGYHEAVFSREYGVERLPSGIYLYRMMVQTASGERFESVKKMILMK
jgi:hypothetical protein